MDDFDFAKEEINFEYFKKLGSFLAKSKPKNHLKQASKLSKYIADMLGWFDIREIRNIFVLKFYYFFKH